MFEVQVFPLVPNVALPTPAPAATRRQVPPGYGVQEQCLPFTAAAALGFLIRSPITFGLCLPNDVPLGCHLFRSPLVRPINGGAADKRVFYVKDDAGCSFVKNAFTFESLEVTRRGVKGQFTPVHPGISFFDREDQLDLFKLHLPYLWRTPPEVDALFLPLINRPDNGLTVMAGLVETDWYASPVNMILRYPPAGQAVHLAAGDAIAQAIFLSRSQRRPDLKVIASHASVARDLGRAMVTWNQQHASDRRAYKKLARSQHGRISSE